MVWLIILVALGFILGSIMTLKYTANMKMKAPKEIENQYNKAFNLDAGEHAKALPDDDNEQQAYSNEYKNEYGKNPMPDDVQKNQYQNK
ncbi:DUF2897 family protein [Moritella marina ATCC 15381]|uniref:DUF2897 family protein n=1 Tax=Moritella marina ATCC 15381 TaxID=1202962 RepID=A0A5J6WI87_MORMI|nr:DUF2897 family protein [Moritella marina]QFI36485.1 DUF2897 family protein [Moritella marina ATCC 15381]